MTDRDRALLACRLGSDTQGAARAVGAHPGSEGMSDTILAYLVSLGIIAAGVIWIVAGMSSATSALGIGIGVLTIAVGLISFLTELRHRI
jgi:hypothetical protein